MINILTNFLLYFLRNCVCNSRDLNIISQFDKLLSYKSFLHFQLLSAFHMASSSSSSSAVIIHCAHDVFLSFTGYDVRRKFRSHFLKELDRKLITFKDDEMERGRSIAPELIKAIQGSRISVVAFSENFANSSWCLDELVEIMRCRENRGQMVIPIFYEVDPSHVRKQTHTFGEIFEWTCNGKTEEQKHMWRQALTNAANIVGEDSRNWYFLAFFSVKNKIK